MHVQKPLENHPKIGPKLIKTPPKIDPWRASGTLWNTYLKNDRLLIDFGVPFGSKMEPKIDQKSIIFQVGVPEGPRGSPGVDFERIFDDFCSYFGMFLVTFSEGFRVCRSIVSHGLLMFQYGCFIDFNGIL